MSQAAPVAADLEEPRVELSVYAEELRRRGALRFRESVEAEFRADYAALNLPRLRIGFLVGAGLYLAFIAVTLLARDSNEALGLLTVLRAAIVGGCLAMFAFTYTRADGRGLAPFVMAGYMLIGAEVAGIEIVSFHAGVERYYEGLMLISIHCYVFSGLTFGRACVATAGIFLCYVLGGALGGMAGRDWAFQLLFLGITDVIGSVALYMIEKTARDNFLRRRVMRDMALRDPLTGLFNRRAFLDHFERVLREARREDEPLGVMVLDVDHFKAFNDRYGHLAGDQGLRQVARVLARAARRPLDICARWGGEEFVGIWFGIRPEALEAVMQRVRDEVAALDIPHDASPHGRLTVSVGAVLARPGEEHTARNLMEAADLALYEAKGAGRNAVVARSLEGAAPHVPTFGT